MNVMDMSLWLLGGTMGVALLALLCGGVYMAVWRVARQDF